MAYRNLTKGAREIAQAIEAAQRAHDERTWWRRVRARTLTDRQRRWAAVQAVRVLVTMAARNVLTVTVPATLSLHDAMLYLGRPAIAAEAWRLFHDDALTLS
ncbi:hypothetical protein [Curtobacterium sp. MCBD17_040]|uniref:hypothetical protein n=1 Tax=Curtobacterium sp. MCBD17_040 TaxID=2175674 RepID=UPI000DA791F9|nr:hypothetical protein [Curtobacterium sp. MCBD17_040]WIB65939.1 hypothetical protein DEI94_17650 [Curtobacterium sp. MCBD17_040]